MDDVFNMTKKNGYVTAVLGRKRYIPENSNSKNFNIKKFLEKELHLTPLFREVLQI